MKTSALTSPSGAVTIVLRGTGTAFSWQLQIRERLADHGRGAEALIAALRTAATHGDRYGAEAVDDMRGLIASFEEDS